MQSLELLLDPALDAAVRAEWAVLAGAGLPSQQHHTGPTNAPHVTLALATTTTEPAEAALPALTTHLPLPLRLGGLLVLGSRRLVLARLVVPSTPLLDLHAGTDEAWGSLAGVPALVRPGRWTPHVTLARSLSAEQVQAAVTTVQQNGAGDLEGQGTVLRRWDPVARRAWTIERPVTT